MNPGGIKRWRRWSRLRRSPRGMHRGTTIAEFALVLTPCLILFFGIINFALALYCYDFVCYSAQQAARYAAVNGSSATAPCQRRTFRLTWTVSSLACWIRIR